MGCVVVWLWVVWLWVVWLWVVAFVGPRTPLSMIPSTFVANTLHHLHTLHYTCVHNAGMVSYVGISDDQLCGKKSSFVVCAHCLECRQQMRSCRWTTDVTSAKCQTHVLQWRNVPHRAVNQAPVLPKCSHRVGSVVKHTLPAPPCMTALPAGSVCYATSVACVHTVRCSSAFNGPPLDESTQFTKHPEVVSTRSTHRNGM